MPRKGPAGPNRDCGKYMQTRLGPAGPIRVCRIFSMELNQGYISIK